jgi:hypothetical protein
VGKSFPHPVAVFCTHLEPPSCHIAKIDFVKGGGGSFYQQVDTKIWKNRAPTHKKKTCHCIKDDLM